MFPPQNPYSPVKLNSGAPLYFGPVAAADNQAYGGSAGHCGSRLQPDHPRRVLRLPAGTGDHRQLTKRHGASLLLVHCFFQPCNLRPFFFSVIIAGFQNPMPCTPFISQPNAQARTRTPFIRSIEHALDTLVCSAKAKQVDRFLQTGVVQCELVCWVGLRKLSITSMLMSTQHSFPPMKSDDRRVVQELAQHYGTFSQS